MGKKQKRKELLSRFIVGLIILCMVLTTLLGSLSGVYAETGGSKTRSVGADNQIGINNEEVTDLYILTCDPETFETVWDEGVTYELYKDKECTKLYKTSTLDKEGLQNVFEKVDSGTYYVKQITAAKGATKSDEAMQVVINKEVHKAGQDVAYTVFNTKAEGLSSTTVLLIGAGLVVALAAVVVVKVKTKKKSA